MERAATVNRCPLRNDHTELLVPSAAQGTKNEQPETLTTRDWYCFVDGTIYVAWDQAENELFAPGEDPHNMDAHVHVKVYDLMNAR